MNMNINKKEEFLRLKNMLANDWFTFWLIMEKLADRVMMHRVLLFQEINLKRFEDKRNNISDYNIEKATLLADILYMAYLNQFNESDFSIVDFLTDYEVQDSIIKLLEFEDEK